MIHYLQLWLTQTTGPGRHVGQDFFFPAPLGPSLFRARFSVRPHAAAGWRIYPSLRGPRPPLDSGGRRCSPGRPPAARPPPQRTTIMLGAGAAARRGGLIFTRGRERGRLPVVDFGVPCGLLVRLLDRR